MKILRSVNRRDFNIEPAGFFNVLRPSARFIPSHLQRVFPYLVRQTKPTGSEEMPELLPATQPGLNAHAILRWALIVLAAVAITLGWLYGSSVPPWWHLVFWRH